MAYKTPGVYVKEISNFPPSVAQVETAIPAFIGYTEKAVNLNKNDLTNIPTKISSLVDYRSFFGEGYNPLKYTVTLDSNNEVTDVAIQRFFLYSSLRSFYDNGGGDCYIVSVGNYEDEITDFDDTNPNAPIGIQVGIDALLKYDEPTMILFPDAVATDDEGTELLSENELGTLQVNALRQCNKLQDRVTIMDLLKAYSDAATVVSNFRDNVGTNNLKYGMAYYPWLSVNYSHEFSLRNVFDDAANKIIDTALSLDVEQTLLVSNYNTESGRTDNVVVQLTGLTIVNFESLLLHYNNLLNKLKETPSTAPATIITSINDILDFLRDVILSFNGVENVAGTGNDIDRQVASLKLDLGLHDQFIEFIKIEKNASVISDLSNFAADTDVDAAYAAYESNTDWLIGSTETFVLISAISGIAGSELDVTTESNNKNKALALINYINENINIELLLSGLQGIFDIAAQNESIAEDFLIKGIPFFSNVALAIEKEMKLLPPSGTMAGVFSYVDNTRGVWKAPANISLNKVLGPAFKVTAKEQESLNVHSTGKSVNVIRSFTGKGVLVWGGRTLAGNDNEWRYISVRRFYNMVEESVKKASEPFVFEPNDANTWVKIKSMIKNYLTNLWRQGALTGASTEQAFFVNVGIGETMTAQDILEGRMIIEIGMAVVRPAEFIILKFSHKMQEA